MIFKRKIALAELLRQKSLLLLGPRQTGKSTLCRELGAYEINLMESDTYRQYSARPELLRERLPDSVLTLFIDEAQRIPEIFNEVQVMVDRNPRLRVVLTGSSARKLRGNRNLNLLPGRIWTRHLHPLTGAELPEKLFDLRFSRGSLPGIITSDHYQEELRHYVGLYLEQEIRAEALTRSVGDFSRFLTTAALTNTQLVNYTDVARDAEVKVNTVRSYYQILCDTLVGFLLEPFRSTPSRKAVATPKFYFFDLGVVNGILNHFEVTPSTGRYGAAFEHLVFLELRAYCDYHSASTPINFWRTQSKIEVDFVVDNRIAIEVKASNKIAPRDEKGLHALAEDVDLDRKIIVCSEHLPRRTESGVDILPLREFVQMLWAGQILSPSAMA